MKLRLKDISMKDKDFSEDLKIKRKIEEDEIFEKIMNSVCDKEGTFIDKGLVRKNSELESNLFMEYMESLEVRPLEKRVKNG